MHHSKNSNGFSTLYTLLIVIVVAIVGCTGWYVWHAKQNTNALYKSVAKTAMISVSKAPTKTKLPAPQQYLDITEWGIKLPLSPAIADAYYVVSTNSNTEGKPNTMWLGLKSLDSIGCKASNANKGGDYPLGAISKSAPGDTDFISGTPDEVQYPNGTHISGYYYSYNSGITGNSPDGCAAKAHIANAAAIDAAFKQAALHIVAD